MSSALRVCTRRSWLAVEDVAPLADYLLKYSFVEKVTFWP